MKEPAVLLEAQALKKKQLHYELPEELERQIVALVGRRGRDAFVREALQQEIERRRVLATRPRLGQQRKGAKRPQVPEI